MTYKKKLIEVALPLAKINEQSAREKSIRHGHPSTLHLWWARRPLAAARAVLWASLVDDPSAHPEQFPDDESQAKERRRLFDILERLVPWEASNDEGVLAEARAEILKSCDGDLPKVLDPFGGGGAIPLEALRLGLPTYSGDLNPVAVLIQRAMLEIPARFADQPPVNPNAGDGRMTWRRAEGLAADVVAYGKWMQQEAKTRIGQFYPDVKLEDGTTATPIAWIWARTVQSPDPAWKGHVPLVRSWELAKKPGKPTIWVEPVIDRATQTISYEVSTGGKSGEGTTDRNGARCLATGTPIPFSYTRTEFQEGRGGQQLLAIVAESDRGRLYVSPSPDSSVDVPKIEASIPGAIFDWPGRMNVVRYGMDEWAKLFTDRQLLALTTFSDLLVDVRRKIEADAANLPDDATRLRDGGAERTAYADAIVTYLAFAIDKCADYWSSICTWNSPGEKMRNTFGRQAIPMAWDFAECNPFSSSTGNWMAMVTWTSKALAVFPANQTGQVRQRDARARIEEVGTCVVSTDPPYYDNISYADLSDFFYVWLRRNVKDIWPDECATLLTPKVEELIANAYRVGSKEAAKTHFELGMEGVFGKALEVADDRFPTTIFYAFKATEAESAGGTSTGWETFLSGLVKNGYVITGTWPIRTELLSKIGANMGDGMLASSIVLSCRRRPVDAPIATQGEFIAALRREMPVAIRLLQAENIAPVDMAQSAIGPGIAIFSRYARVVDVEGKPIAVRAALAHINSVLSEVLSGEESELDPDSRFALTWFEQFGLNPGPYGSADVLAKAKNSTVAGVVEAGIAVVARGKLQLLERKDLPDNWNPIADSRLTVWETTQYLIRALDESERSAARLLRTIGGGLGERARQMAYLLYGISERKKWADEATAYNTLITSWPRLEQLAASSDLDPQPGEAPPTLDF